MTLDLDGKSKIMYLTIILFLFFYYFICMSFFTNKCISKSNKSLTHILCLNPIAIIIGIQNMKK